MASSTVVAASTKSTTSERAKKKKSPVVEETKSESSESEEENEEEKEDLNDSSTSKPKKKKKKVEEEGPIFEDEQQELETYRSLNLPDGVLRVLRDARNADFRDFEFHKSYGNVSELGKYAGKKQHSVTCKSCHEARSPIYCRLCTFRGPMFPQIIAVHTDEYRHPGCADKHRGYMYLEKLGFDRVSTFYVAIAVAD